jgi:hypothetical protein
LLGLPLEVIAFLWVHHIVILILFSACQLLFSRLSTHLQNHLDQSVRERESRSEGVYLPEWFRMHLFLLLRVRWYHCKWVSFCT